jgi:twinkle protein
VIFLDHLSIVGSGLDGVQDERRSLDRMMTKLASLAQETQCAVVAVSHLSRREGTPHEEGRTITLADLRGSHGLSQLAHTVIAIERDQQADDEDERNRSTVRVLKCRFTGDTGPAGYLRYHVDTGRQLEELETAEELTEAGDDGTL